MSVYKLVCPACGHRMRIRTSQGQTPCFRSTYYECTNILCAATFAGAVTIEYQLSPSGLERPLMELPLAPSRIRQKARQDQAGDTAQVDLFDSMEAST
ncbi:ogr/Delta-like zinc finger family protein [Pseudomonas solani]|uniref:ogr/Delta-like zinc finger family protein n=1 Tax=Pseudomonas TaxID=286 RepID=UPI000DA82875|nr:ogr/Delta-like zinc finger family protein [Pseudomonas sp. 57B-090624]PZE12265.1 transcriptional regulator [Pseudomonas sp. 57B-090624]